MCWRKYAETIYWSQIHQTLQYRNRYLLFDKEMLLGIFMEPPIEVKPLCLRSAGKNLVTLLGKSYVLEMLYFMNTHNKPVRFNELKRELSITATTLSRRLDEFAYSNLLVREVFAEVPARVEYSLSEKGKSLGPVLKNLFSWVERNSS